MFIKLFVLALLIFKIYGNERTTYLNCDFDLLDLAGLNDDQKVMILSQFPDECKALSDVDKGLSKQESKKFAEFNAELRKFDGGPEDPPRIDEYDQFYYEDDLLKCNNNTLPYEEYINCILVGRGNMIELIKSTT